MLSPISFLVLGSLLSPSFGIAEGRLLGDEPFSGEKIVNRRVYAGGLALQVGAEHT
jgi:hypothetical protein